MPSLIASGSASNTATNPAVVSAVDTSGATLLIVTAANASSTSYTVSDFYGNTWIPLTNKVHGVSNGKMFYAENPIVGPGHTFTCVGNYVSITASAWGNIATTSPFHQENGASAPGAGSTLTPGSVTPNSANDLIVTMLAHRSIGTASIDDGFTKLIDIPYVGGVKMGNSFAYKLDATGAENPTWSESNPWADAVAVIATFKQTAGGVIVPVFRYHLQTQGIA